MLKRALPVVVSLALIAFLWWSVDVAAIARAMASAKPAWLIAGILAVVPLTWGTALRFQWLSRTAIGTGTAGRLILAACTLNLVLPSKMGDLAKAWVLERRYSFDRGLAVPLVVFEKLLDMAALLVCGLAALVWLGHPEPIYLLATAALAGALALCVVALTPLAAKVPVPQRFQRYTAHWFDLVQWFWADRGRATATLALSLLLWAGHLAQLWLFARALGPVPLADSMAAATLSILAGLLPFTMAGIGTRDLAIVYFYHAWLSPAQCAALGLLATLRYLLPAIAGLPFVGDYWQRRRETGE